MEVKRGDKLLDENAYLAWQDLVENHLKLTQSLEWFFSTEVDRIEVLRHGFQKGHLPAVLYAIAYMESTEISELLNELVWFATSHGYAQAIHKIVGSLPRQVITEKVLPVIEETLSHQPTDDEYRRILELCVELDRKFACRLAQQALLHPNAGIRETGEDVIQLLGCDKV